MVKKSILAVWVLWQSVLAWSSRPVQDDYGYLNIGSNSGFTSYLSNFWSQWGGNLAPSVFRVPFYMPSISGESWIGFALFSLLTATLVMFSSVLITTWLTGRSLRENNSIDLIIGALVCFGFEGLFSPGVLSAFVFGPAASTHLLPICFLVIGLWLCTIQIKTVLTKVAISFSLLISGFIAGNSNIAESLAAFAVCASLLLAFWFKRELFTKLAFLDFWRVAILSASVAVGMITIVISPGFTNRADSGSGLPGGLQELLIRFRSSFVSFTAEIVTHPMWMLIILFTVIYMRKNTQIHIAKERAFALILLTFLVYGFLIIGTTFAYAAWHQSGGLLFLLTPAGIAIAHFLCNSKRLSNALFVLSKPLLVSLTLLMVALVGRVTILEVQHGLRWDKNLSTNYCLLIQDSNAPLLGSEIKYPPIGLGIEDVSTWPWMRDDYAKWVLSPRFSKEIDC